MPPETSPRSAFWEGFWKGLAAPAMLYEQPPTFPTLDLPGDLPKRTTTDAEAIAKDWEAVGQALYSAMGKLPPKR